MVEHLHGGGGIVDRGRQRLDGDVDHDPDRERGILLDRALHPEGDHPRGTRSSASAPGSLP